MSQRPFVPAQATPVRLAETIAAELRQRILNGTLEGVLPKQDELMEMFGVSGPSLREALRVLEAEGLVTVRRGNIGGAAIHRPNGGSVAHAIGLTLQGEGTRLSDLAEALLALEPMCAAACAAWKDRLTELSPILDENLERTEDLLGEGPEFTQLSREFHIAVVGCTPNPVLRLVVRSLVTVWSIQEEAWASEAEERGTYPDVEVQREVLAAHRAMAQWIRAGEADVAERVARHHLRANQTWILEDYGDRVVDTVSYRATTAFRNLSSVRNHNWDRLQPI